MDLPTCPSCRQSVLDDDADECPFCGASMSGKPTTPKTASKPEQIKSEPSAKPLSPKAESRAKNSEPVASRPEEPEEDDPFELEKKAEIKAIRLRKKPEPGRSHKVVCPMCETPGFTARKAAGMQVCCVNSECLMPVFTAPLLEQQSESPLQELDKPNSKAVWISVVVVVVLSGCFGLWYFVFGEGNGKVKPAAKLAKMTPQRQPVIPKKKNPEQSAKKKPKEIQSGPLISQTDLEKHAFDHLKRVASLDRENLNKSYCRENCAVAFAAEGRLDDAKDQIRKLENIAPNSPFYRVLPWLEISWWHLNQSSPTSRDESLAAWKKAESSYRRVPAQAAIRFELTAARAAFRYATGEKESARNLIKGFAPFQNIELLSVRKLALEKLKLFDRERHRLRTFFSVEGDLMGAAVALELVSQGRRNLAFEWALDRATNFGKGDALLAWLDGEMLRSGGNSITAAELEAKFQNLTPEIKTVVFAHIAAFHQSQSAEFLKMAEAAFSKFPLPEPLLLKTVRDVATAALSKKKWIPRAIAAFQLAIARNIVVGNDNGTSANSAIEKGVDYLRSATPGIEIVRIRQEQERTEKEKLREEIVKEYRLNDNTAIEIQLRDYKQTLQLVNKNAVRRFHLQFELLSWVSLNADAPLLEKIWNSLESNRTENEINRKDPYFETALPWLLIALLELKGEAETAKSLQAKLRNLEVPIPNETALTISTIIKVTQIETESLARKISSLENRSLQLDSALIVASRLVKSGKPKIAVEFAKHIEEGTLRLDVLQNIGGLMIVNKQRDQANELMNHGTLHPAEMSALCRGIFWGLQAVESSY